MANSSRSTFANRDVFLGIVFALLAAVGFSAKAILVKLAYLDHVDAVTLLALRMVFSVPFFIGVALRSSPRPRCRHSNQSRCSVGQRAGNT